MKGMVTSARVPIKLWVPVEQVESSALDQPTNTASLPCVFHHIAAMPDVHLEMPRRWDRSWRVRGRDSGRRRFRYWVRHDGPCNSQ